VRIDVDPDLSATLDLAGHRDTGGLDLAVGQPPRVESLEAVLAELDLDLTARQATTATAVLLAVLDALGSEHQPSPPPPGAPPPRGPRPPPPPPRGPRPPPPP